MMMDRRALMGFMAGAAALGWKGRCRAAGDGDNGVFWQLDIPGGGTAVVFGGWKIAGSVVPEIVRDGRMFVERTQRMIGQYPDFTFPKIDIPKDIKPFHTVVSRELADAVRVIVAGFYGGPFETLPPAMIPLLLISEGQTPMPPGVPLAFMMRGFAQQLQRPFAFLLSESEVKALLGPPDLSAANDAVSEALIAHMIALRRQHGPLGRYVEQLYAARNGAGLQRFNDGLREHGLVGLMGFSETAMLAVRNAILEPMLEAIASQPGVSLFALELGVLTGADGIFAQLRRRGATISVLA